MALPKKKKKAKTQTNKQKTNCKKSLGQNSYSTNQAVNAIYTLKEPLLPAVRGAAF